MLHWTCTCVGLAAQSVPHSSHQRPAGFWLSLEGALGLFPNMHGWSGVQHVVSTGVTAVHGEVSS